MPLNLCAIAIMLMACSGVPGLLLPRHSPRGQRIATGMVCLGALTGLSGVAIGFIHPDGAAYILPWNATGGSLIALDALSAFFLVPILIVGGLGSIYGLGYWPQARKARTAPKLQFFWGTMMAGMSLLVVSAHAMAFLLGWEFMALSAFFLVSTEDDRTECRKSGIVYIIATHIGTLTLFGLFALWRRASGSFAFAPLQGGAIPALTANALFFLSFFGFGLKAGMMPLHFWLPGAHANAPSHVSAVLSGVMLKMGIYGLVRMTSLLPAPPRLWGGILLVSGAASGILGVAFALAQHDVKRLLAYHSVENIGIILMGLGLAMLGKSLERPDWILLGMAACLLHTWNHSFFKSLLFFGAGSVLTGTRTRAIDRLGGLAKRMPWTAAFFLAGAVAICGLPPMNGFISEFFLYVGLFRTFAVPGSGASMAIAAAPVLAMIGALAVACFVKVYGVAFLGSGRSRGADMAVESPESMLIPMAALAALCLAIGPRAGGGRAHPREDHRGVAAHRPGILRRGRSRRADSPRNPWVHGAGHPRRGRFSSPSSSKRERGDRRLQGRAPGIAGTRARRVACSTRHPPSRIPLVGLFRWALKPRTSVPLVEGAFPRPASMASHVDEPILDRALSPAFSSIRRGFGWFHRFQQGQTHQYMFYILSQRSSRC